MGWGGVAVKFAELDRERLHKSNSFYRCRMVEWQIFGAMCCGCRGAAVNFQEMLGPSERSGMSVFVSVTRSLPGQIPWVKNNCHITTEPTAQTVDEWLTLHSVPQLHPPLHRQWMNGWPCTLMPSSILCYRNTGWMADRAFCPCISLQVSCDSPKLIEKCHAAEPL